MITILTILEAAAVAAALSADAFAASFAYGSNKIKIPFLSAQIINLICCAILGLSLLAGCGLKQFIPNWLTAIISFILLLIMGLSKLLDSLIKSLIRKYSRQSRNLSFSVKGLHMVLSIYADPQKADRDNSQTISAAEAASLALALSLDGLAVGFGAVVICSLVTNTAAICLGSRLGNKAAQKLPWNISWISGAILIILAVSKLF